MNHEEFLSGISEGIRREKTFGEFLREETLRGFDSLPVEGRLRIVDFVASLLDYYRGGQPSGEPAEAKHTYPDNLLNEARQSLSEGEEKVFYGYFVLGMSPSEIADAHGLSKQAVRVRLNRVIRKIRGQLEISGQSYGAAGSKNITESSALAQDNFVGMWRDRDDMRDSSTWVRARREDEWVRRRG